MQILILETAGGKDQGKFTSDDQGDFPQNLHACAQGHWPTFSLEGTITLEFRAVLGIFFFFFFFSGDSKRLTQKPSGRSLAYSPCSIQSIIRIKEDSRLQQRLRSSWLSERLHHAPLWKPPFYLRFIVLSLLFNCFYFCVSHSFARKCLVFL